MKIAHIPRAEECKDLDFCIEDCLATICNNMGIEYQPIFNRPAILDYKKDDCLCMITYNGSMRSMAEHYAKQMKQLGVSINIKNGEWKELYKDIRDSIANEKPVVTIFDSYYCPWDPAYQESHRVHTFIIFGFNEETSSFICMDPYFDEESIEMLLEVMEKGCEDILTFDMIENAQSLDELQPDNKEYVTLLKKNHENLFDFCDYISEVTSIRNSEESFWNYPVFTCMNTIIGEVYTSLLFIEYSKTRNTKLDLVEYEERFQEVFYQWVLIRSILIKTYCAKKNVEKHLNKLTAQIKKALEIEGKLYEEIWEKEQSR